MEPARKLVVDAAPRHLFERHGERLARLLVAAAHRHLQQQIERRRMRKLRLRAEPAVARVELASDRAGNLVHQRRRQLAPPRPEKLSLCSMAAITLRRRLQRFVAPLAPHLRHRHQHPPNARPPIAVVARNIRAAKVRPPIGRQKRRQRPAALPADRRHRRLVARIHVRPLVAIHLHRDK